MRLALVQMRAEKHDVSGNLQQMRRYVAKYAAADLIVFPEMCIAGYVDPLRHPEAQMTFAHPSIREVVAMSKQSPALVAGFIEVNGAKKPYITQFVARDGEVIAIYRKITIIDEELEWFSPGSEHVTFEHRGVTIGLSVCADVENEAVYAGCAAAGAQLVLNAAAPGLYGEQATRDWQSGYAWWRGFCRDHLSVWAKQHGIFIAVATQAGRTIDEDFPGGGFVFGPNGDTLAETADWSEGVLSVDVHVNNAGG